MNKKTIPASDLPLLSGLIKDVINSGMWFLYKIEYGQNQRAKYSLSTDKGEFLIDDAGEVLSPVPRDGQVKYVSSVTFTGIPTPPAINMPVI